MQGLSWGVPVVTGVMSMGRGIVLAALCIPLTARRGGPCKSELRASARRFMCAARHLVNKFPFPCGHKKTAVSLRFPLAVKGGFEPPVP